MKDHFKTELQAGEIVLDAWSAPTYDIREMMDFRLVSDKHDNLYLEFYDDELHEWTGIDDVTHGQIYRHAQLVRALGTIGKAIASVERQK